MGYAVRNCPAFQEVFYSDEDGSLPVSWCTRTSPIKKCREVENCWIKWIIETLQQSNKNIAVREVIKSLDISEVM